MCLTVNPGKAMFLCDYKSLYGGNFIPSLMELDAALEKQGTKVIYVFPREASRRYWFEEMKKQGKVLLCFSQECGKWAQIKELQHLINENNIRILHSHFMSQSVVAALSFRNPKVTVLAHIHSDFTGGSITWKLRMWRFLFYRALPLNIHYLSVSSAFAEYNPRKITWIPNALADNRIPCKRIGGEAIRERLGLREKDILLEIFAWSPFIKGLDIAVNAVRLLNEEKDIPVKLAIICGRQMTRDKMPAWVAEHTLCTGTESYLTYLEPTEDVFSYHEATDIMLSASRSEGFSYAILEMLSLGKRCVVSDIPGVSWSKVYRSVVPFETENVEACMNSIFHAIKELPEKDNAVVDAIAVDYSIDKWVSAVLTAYDLGE